MSCFRERIGEYMKDMGLRHEDLAKILNYKGKAIITSYTRLNNARTPTFDGLIEMADKLAVTLDWLAGRSPTNKWGSTVQTLRMELRAKAPSIVADNVMERVRQVLALIQDSIPQGREPWFVGGILGLSQADFVAFTAGGYVGSHSIRRLADFTLLPYDWFWDGELHRLNQPDLAEYTEAVLTLANYGVKPTFLLSQAEEIARRAAIEERVTSTKT